jgi:glucosamine--fructose-6-phosphate aminotransferase (isomerizing)
MGSSYFVSMAAAALLRHAGRPAFALSATDLLEPGAEGLGAAYIGLSQSGKSTETVEAFSRLTAPRLAVTNSGDGPLAGVADVALPIGSIADTAIAVPTYTASLLVLAVLAGSLGAQVMLDTPRAASFMTDVISRSELVVDAALDAFASKESVDFAGRGTALATAAEGALLVREAVRIPASCMDTYQYLHGPLEVAESGRACVLIGSDREVQLAQDLASYGTSVLLITEAPVPSAENLWVVPLPRVPESVAPIFQIVPIQLLTHRMARARGLEAAGFRYHQPDTKLVVA